MSNRFRAPLLSLLLSFGVPSPAQSESEFGLSWDSRYVAEGRENIPGSGLLSSYGNIHGDHFAVGYWAATGDSENFREIQVWAGYQLQVGPAKVLTYYTNLSFPDDHENSNDHELALEIHITESGLGITPFLLYRYAHVAEGDFFELGAERNFAIARNVSLTPYVLVGINNGFVKDEHKGWNNLQGGVNLSYYRTDSFGIHAYIAYSMALQEEAGESLKDLLWFGVNLSKSF